MPCGRSLFRLAAFVFGVATATAQEPSTALDATVLAKDLLVPLHTQPADPIGGEYGIWAAGPDYKASFHDGFTFYPVLGPTAPNHLPLTWRTESVAVGEQMLPLGEGVVSWSGVRFERDFGEIVEAYDVRRDGVEQTFTLRRRPAATGDLVITGAITTPLACEPVAAAWQELVFRNGGDAVIRYGKATAFDADGRQSVVSTAFHGGRIRLVLSGSFLAAATYPVVVDPIISYFTVSTFLAFGPRPVITAETIANGKIVLAWSRNATSTDLDSYVLATDRDFTGGALIFTDITASWSSIDVDATYVGQASRWVVSQTRSFSSTSSAVRVYLHDVGNTSLNSGVLLSYNAPAGNRDFGPVVGGSRFGGTALVVANRLNTASGLRIIVGVRINAMTQTLGSEMSFTGQLLEQLQAPRITPLAFSSGGWVVAMIGSSGIRVANVPGAGSGGMPTQLLVPAGGMTLSGLIGLPSFHLAGTDGRYVLNYASWTNPGTGPIDRISTVRFDWPSGAANPTVLATRTLVSQPNTSGFAVGVGLGGIEYDRSTRSHWALGYSDASGSYVSRLGYRGGVTETQPTPGLSDVAFGLVGAEGSFPLAFSTVSLGGTAIVGSELGYPTDAISVVYGTSCASSGVSVSTSRSYAGHEFYRVLLNNVAPGTPAIYVLGTAPGSFDLTGNGMPGCFLNVALPALGSVAAVADASGNAQVVLALPDVPLFLGDVFSQWFYYEPAAAPVPFRALYGVKHQVR